MLQLLEESRVYQVIPFMTHLELNHIKDDKMDSEKAHKGQEAVKLVNAGLQPEYRGRFKLQVTFFLPSHLSMCKPTSQQVYLNLHAKALNLPESVMSCCTGCMGCNILKSSIMSRQQRTAGV